MEDSSSRDRIRALVREVLDKAGAGEKSGAGGTNGTHCVPYQL